MGECSGKDGLLSRSPYPSHGVFTFDLIPSASDASDMQAGLQAQKAAFSARPKGGVTIIIASAEMAAGALDNY